MGFILMNDINIHSVLGGGKMMKLYLYQDSCIGDTVSDLLYQFC